MTAKQLADLRWVRDFIQDALGGADDRAFVRHATRARKTIEHLIAARKP